MKTNLNGGCLLPNEEIIVKNRLVLMSEIKVGDKVLSHDGDYHVVTHVWNFEKPTYYVSFSNGDHIECSNTHRFLVNKNKIDKESSWKTAEELHDGDEIFTMSIINMDINEKIKETDSMITAIKNNFFIISNFKLLLLDYQFTLIQVSFRKNYLQIQ